MKSEHQIVNCYLRNRKTETTATSHVRNRKEINCHVIRRLFFFWDLGLTGPIVALRSTAESVVSRSHGRSRDQHIG